MDNIVIVGGGTAGWMTALYAQRVLPHTKITLIESESIGILGAGEGSTPAMVSFLDFVGIPVSELVANCRTTIKNSIKFVNWRGNGDTYHHAFNIQSLFDPESMDGNFYIGRSSSVYAPWAVNRDMTLDPIYLPAVLANQNKVPLIAKYDGDQAFDSPMSNFEASAFYSLHFDASLIAKYLRAVAESRGVVRIEGIVDEVLINEQGNVSSVRVNDLLVHGDFFFDCTGFRRLIIGQSYNAHWNSYSDYLPNDKAMPFFTETDSTAVPPYTEAIAMSNGWMWRIPLQHRTGNGYVYDSSRLSDDDAKDEIEKLLGHEVTVPRVFSFKAGCYETPWVNNCCAIGLSTGFIEPLEAMSIATTIASLDEILGDPIGFMNYTQNKIDSYNKRVVSYNHEVRDFLYLHYLTRRADTEYWASFGFDNAPESLKVVLNKLRNGVLKKYDFTDKLMYGYWSYLAVILGNDVATEQYVALYKYLCDQGDGFETNAALEVLFLEQSIAEHAFSALDHADFLRIAGGFNF